MTGRLYLSRSEDFSSTESQAFPDDSGGQRLSVLRELGDRETDQRALSASARYQHSEQLQFNVLVGSNKHEEISSSPAVAPGVGWCAGQHYDSKLQRENMALHGVFDWWMKLKHRWVLITFVKRVSSLVT